MLLEARTENDRLVKSSEDAIRQAGRNLLLSFRESVTRELDALVKERVASVYSSDDFAQADHARGRGLGTQSDAGDLTVLMNSADLDRLEETLLTDLKARMLDGVTLKASDRFDGGFRIAMKDGGIYYDFSAEACGRYAVQLPQSEGHSAVERGGIRYVHVLSDGAAALAGRHGRKRAAPHYGGAV